MEKHKIVRDAYVFGYPLVTMDMTRKHETNVRAADDAHAPMGQLIKLRAYPPVEDHGAAAPECGHPVHDGVARRVGRAVGVQHPRHGRPLLHHADAERLQRGVLRRRLEGHGRRGSGVRHHRAGLVGRVAGRRDARRVAHRAGVDPRTRLLRRHTRGLQGSPRTPGPASRPFL